MDKGWDAMPDVVTDEYSTPSLIEAASDEVGNILKERYEGFVGCVVP